MKKTIKTRGFLAILCLSVAAVTWLFGCAPVAVEQEVTTPEMVTEEEATPVPEGKTLIVAIPEDLRTLDPAVSIDNKEWKVTYPSYERLVAYKGAETEVQPSLAESWDISEDGLVWTFSLAKGHTFSDGTPVDAQAVKFTFDRMFKVEGSIAEVYFPVIEKVEAVDDYTVRFTLKERFAPFLYTLATNAGSIVNPKVMDYEKEGDLGGEYLATAVMGSGKYVLSEWRRNEIIVMEARQDLKEAPAISKVIIKIIPESSSQRLLLEKGDVDIAEGIEIEQIAELEDNPDLQVFKAPGLFTDYVYINTSRPPLDNPKVRQAIAYAIDYEGIIKSVQMGKATQFRGFVPQGLWGHLDDIKMYTRDVEKAKALIKEAGFPNGFKISLSLSSRKPWWEQEALIIQSNLKEVGIDVEIQQYADPTLRDRIDRGEFDLCMGVWMPDYADPYMYLNYWFDSNNKGLAGNRAFYETPKVDEMLRQAATETDHETRLKLYTEVQKLLVEEPPYIMLYQKNYELPMRKNIKGFIFNPMLQDVFFLDEMDKA